MELNNPNNFLLHSVQIYWNNIADTLEDVKSNMSNNMAIEHQFEIALNNIINTVHENSNLYGVYLRNNIYRINYENRETLFYHQLENIIHNREFLIILQNIVNTNIEYGVRYFFKFLSAINVE